MRLIIHVSKDGNEGDDSTRTTRSLENVRERILAYEHEIKNYLDHLHANVGYHKFSAEKHGDGVTGEVSVKATIRPEPKQGTHFRMSLGATPARTRRGPSSSGDRERRLNFLSQKRVEMFKNEDAHADLTNVGRIASSAAMLRLADSILNLGRRDVSQLIAAYLYFESVGRSNQDFLSFITTKQAKITITIGLAILPSFVTGLLNDRDLRALIFNSLESAIRKSPAS